MLYSMLIYETEADFARRTDPAEREAYWAEWPRYAQALRDAGVYAGGSGLLPPETATTLRFAGAEPQVQDGPYADTKEQLGGFFIFDVPDLDAAMQWAARCPRSPGRVLELRPCIAAPPR
jgi:hypothetical protein